MRLLIQFMICLLCSTIAVKGQDTVPPIIKDTTWKMSGFFGVNASQTALSDWQGGGQDNIGLGSILNVDIIYKPDEFEQWQNKLDAQFGVIRQGTWEGFRKNIDQLFFLSKYSTRAFGKHWYWASQADYRTQFGPGHTYAGDTIVGNAVSDFNSPAYVQLALGLEYKPRDYFSASLLPIAGKMTIVARRHLANDGAFGLEPAQRDTSGNVITPASRVRMEAGGRIILKFKKDIVKNVNLDSYLDLFTNYFEDPGNFDVVFNNLVTIKIGRYFTVNFISQVLYDNDVIRKRDWDRDGKYDSPQDINGPRVQALTTMAVGFGYKF